MDVVINGNKAAVYPLFVTNTSTGIFTASWRENGKLRFSKPIKAGGQERVFAGEMNEIEAIVSQFQRQGYVEKSQASNILLPNGDGNFKAATHVYYTIGQPDNIESISQVVEHNQEVVAEQIQTDTNAKAASLKKQKGSKDIDLTGLSIQETA